MAIAACAECHYPISAGAGEEISCPMCQTVNEIISQGVTIPTWLFAGSVGLLIGIIVGPAMIGSTEGGAAWLRKQATKKF